MTTELEEVKIIRKKVGITQTDLADLAGVSQSMIAKIESGMLDPTYSNARKIITALDDLTKKQQKKVHDVMQKKIIATCPSATLKECISLMKKHAISQLPVVDAHEVVGLVSESSVLDSILEGTSSESKITDVMTDAPPAVSSDTTTEVAAHLLKHYPLVSVKEKGKLVGVITKSDLLKVVA